jgi:sugar phosphate isomerase/epimerase
MPLPVTRRESLLAAAAPALARAAAPAPRTVQIGMATTQFTDQTNESLARELSGQGIKVVQFFFAQTDSNYWKYGQRSDLEGMTPQRAREIAGIYRAAGIRLDAVGVYATLIHPDPAERKANLAYFDKMMKLGEHLGCRVFLSEMGHYQPLGPAPRVSYDWQDEVWITAVATAKELARAAETNNATVLLEPIYRSLLASAKRTRVFLEEVGSARVRAQLDPANLLEVNDLEEMFAQLKPWIGGIHAKDRKLHVTKGVGAGQGDLDYDKFVRLSVEHAPGIPLILEYVGTSDYRQALAHLRGVIHKAGLAEG